MGKRLSQAILVVLILGIPAAAQAVTPENPDWDVMAASLRELVAGGGEGEIEALVQFDGTVRERDLLRLRAIGMRPLHQYTVVPAVFVKGTPAQLRMLSAYERVRHMEFNEPLEFYMHETTNVINATLAWASKVVTAGNETRGGFDGSGITVVVVDSGIDAGHPDLDYGTKTIMNLKSDSDLGWYEIENSDTSSGHGTHVAGTVAGNGDASGGSRRGTAPGANLIGLSTGEALSIYNGLGALDWVYEHSRPGSNPHNIRAATNSWGSSGDYDPNNAINQATSRIVYDNNVVVLFAAGNEGEDNHDGHEVTTGSYSIHPPAIGVAAHTHDGTGMADFTSRGSADDDFTWPDVGAPGVSIWSTQARRTLISAMTNSDGDAYYMAISGTSMATPHMAGIVALLWQAAPSLKVSDQHDDNSLGDEAYRTDPGTRIHEAELILKLTARYVNASADNGVPTGINVTGLLGKPLDFAQGYGITQVDRAVGVALTLEELRRTSMPNATVFDAYAVYENVSEFRYLESKTDRVEAKWSGEWGQLVSLAGGQAYTSQQHFVYVPEEATTMTVDMQYAPMSTEDGVTNGRLTLEVDANADGSVDWSGGEGAELDVASLGGGGGYWAFDVTGVGVHLRAPTNFLKREYSEARIEYDITVMMELVPSENGSIEINATDYHANVAQLVPIGAGNGSGNTTLRIMTHVYDLNELVEEEEVPVMVQEASMPLWPFLLLGLLAALGVGYLLYRRNSKAKDRTSAGTPTEAKAVEPVAEAPAEPVET